MSAAARRAGAIRVAVDFLPSRDQAPGDLAVVVDVLRATSTLAALLDAGVRRVLCAGEIELARSLARDHRFLLCGEVGGLPPEGFDFGNSPLEVARRAPEIAASGGVVMFTTNGTKALARSEPGATLAASLLNARAAALAALDLARTRGCGIRIACAGEGAGSRFALEDCYAAGAVVTRLRAMAAEELDLDDSARTAERLTRSYASPMAAFEDSSHGRDLLAILPDDLPACAREDVVNSVPSVTGRQAGYVVVEPFRPA